MPDQAVWQGLPEMTSTFMSAHVLRFLLTDSDRDPPNFMGGVVDGPDSRGVLLVPLAVVLGRAAPRGVEMDAIVVWVPSHVVPVRSRRP